MTTHAIIRSVAVIRLRVFLWVFMMFVGLSHTPGAAVCRGTPMITGRHYAEFTLVETSYYPPSFGVVPASSFDKAQDFDVPSATQVHPQSLAVCELSRPVLAGRL